MRRTLAFLIVALVPTASSAQSNQSPSVVLPTVIVTAQKEASDVKEVPASVTAVTAETIANSGLRAITDAVIFAPNSVFTEFTARKVSNARFRGIGSSPANPAITTYLDGVPQLNSNSSNIELLDIGQIEFVRGPQSPLFGRNTLGGIVNVTTARPSMSAWTGALTVPFGNAGMWDARGNVSGPIGDKAAIGFAAGKQQRDGFTENAITLHDLDSRDGTFAKAQALFLPNANWEARVIYAYERDRDGDYALGDLDAIRLTPFRVARDYEGFTNRDINNTTVNIRGTGQSFAIESTTGFIKWDTEDSTDLDYSPLPLATRDNFEESTQFTQQVRLSSPDNAPLAFGSTMVKWQAGIEYFNQAIEKDPSYAQAYAGMALAYVIFPQYSAGKPAESMPKGKAAARKALELDDTLAEAHTALGQALFSYDRNVAESDRAFQHAIELNPNYATAHQWYAGGVLVGTGRFDQAITEGRRAVELDPLSLIANVELSAIYGYARKNDQAIAQLRKVIDIDPNWYLAHMVLGQMYSYNGQFPEAIVECEKARSLNDDPATLGYLARAYALAGKRDEAMKVVAQMHELAKQRYVPAYSFAFAYTALGDQDQAFQWLERCLQEEGWEITFVKVDPALDSLRSDARFADLVRRVGL
jgi:outer membrane receptor protein involved in Fe transport